MLSLTYTFSILCASFGKYLWIFRCPIRPIQEAASGYCRLQFIRRSCFNRIQLLIAIAFKSYHIGNISVYAEILSLKCILVTYAPTVCDGWLTVMKVYSQVDGVLAVQVEQALSGCTFETFLIVSQRKIFLWVNASRNGKGRIVADTRRIGKWKEDSPGSIDVSISIEEYTRTSSIIASKSTNQQHCKIGLLLAHQLFVLGQEVEGLAGDISAYFFLAGELLQRKGCLLAGCVLPQREYL